MSKADFAVLKKTLTGLFLACLVSVVVVAQTTYLYSEAYEKNQSQKILLDEYRQKTDSVIEDTQILYEFLPVFEEMSENGLIGEEDRLDWVETLRNVAHELGLEKIEYRIDEQKLLEDENLSPTGDYEIRKSAMKLSMELLHEADFLHLVRAMKENANGLFFVDGCKLHRINEMISRDTLVNLNIECQLSWFTIRYPQISSHKSGDV